MPLFSVVIPTYNRASFVGRSIDSVLSQSYNNWELIVVDDGSTDNTKEVVGAYKDPRVKYHYQENQERSAARNKGVSMASGKYICFLDSDDEFTIAHLDNLHKRIQELNAPVAVFMTGMSVLSEGNKEVACSPLPERSDLVQHILLHKLTVASLLCSHREILLKHKFDERFSLWEDTHLWLRVFSQYPYHAIEESSIIIHAHESSGVVEGMAKVKLKDAKRYARAVNDLFENYSFVLPVTERNRLKQDYIHAKFQMYIYRARVNRQFKLVIKLIGMAKKNRLLLKDIFYYIKTTLKVMVMVVFKASIK